MSDKQMERVYCGNCDGSGEGMHERERCYVCKGEGEVWQEVEEETTNEEDEE